jgi:predicted phosphodiesterase
MTRILAIADEVDEALYGDKLQRLNPDVILSCGDLPYEYLENLVSRVNVPLLYVPGNHDPSIKPAGSMFAPLVADPASLGPDGCVNADGRVVEAGGLRVAGLGGSILYNRGPNQYTQAQMRWRALKLDLRIRLKHPRTHKLDVLITHAPPFGWGAEKDAAHIGFVAFTRLIKDVAPRLLIHGHVHPYGRVLPKGRIGSTEIINAVPSRLIEL